MKKRLLALALCLVLMTSLLPITAAADVLSQTEAEKVFKGLKDGNVYCKEIQFEFHPEFSDNKKIPGGEAVIVLSDQIIDINVTTIGKTYTLHVLQDEEQAKLFPTNLDGDILYKFKINLKTNHSWSAWAPNGDGTHSRTCGNGCVDSPQKDYCADNNADCKCDDCGASMHTWQFKAAGNTLTGYCGSCNQEVSVSLKADSVTLPKSPFETAQLVGWNDFQTATGAGKEDFVYRYKGPGDETFGDPFYADPAKIKAGQYQVGVTITNLPGNVEDGNVAARANTNSAYLFTQYTAADPKVTAQTGDDRPIELMMASVLAFSALAAAAFALDSKRRSQQ